MKGTILDYSIQSNAGIISGDDQQRYTFTGAEWRAAQPPSRGMRVDFILGADQQAEQIYMSQGSATPLSQRSMPNTLKARYKNEEQYNLFDWFMKCMREYATFSGRARRKEYWFFYLVSIGITIIAQVFDAIIGSEPMINGLVNLLLLIPTFAAGARRLHDTGRSGWWQLLVLTIIGIIPLIIWLATDTSPEENEHGQPARQI